MVLKTIRYFVHLYQIFHRKHQISFFVTNEHYEAEAPLLVSFHFTSDIPIEDVPLIMDRKHALMWLGCYHFDKRMMTEDQGSFQGDEVGTTKVRFWFNQPNGAYEHDLNNLI
eukprot:GHVP01036034.1.p1 GENE.GHVP01036034.1~~GHVP01036034.1.p1  ORF type:complete len:112 (+),score=6.32 GHVP01036034.1:449-784(+)